jgi:hypothetical protein
VTGARWCAAHPQRTIADPPDRQMSSEAEVSAADSAATAAPSRFLMRKDDR